MPEPEPGEVLVRIEACGLNFADILMENGLYQETPKPPFTLGMEVAGTVEKTGASVKNLMPGQRVALFSGSGGLAEYGCFPAERCLLLPNKMPFQDAAAFQIAYGTSHLALSHRAGLQAGETVLVLGAAGGVGLTAVEIAKLMGARVIAVARGKDKLDVARRAGADHLIDSETEDIRASVRELGGADVVYDPVGGEQFTAALRACNPEARIVVIGFASGDIPQVPANIILVKNITVIGHYWGGYLRFAPEVLAASLTELLGWYQEGKLRPHVSHVRPLAHAAEALDLLRHRKSTGKIVVTPQPAKDRT
ncbi:MAG TPA: NADPH:quinone oxidoreductase family protein [Rhodobacteraceae bacterium]|nr:NADPH:quinone oxidoreductase family protein [Paracoccaceae bacterium]